MGNLVSGSNPRRRLARRDQVGNRPIVVRFVLYIVTRLDRGHSGPRWRSHSVELDRPLHPLVVQTSHMRRCWRDGGCEVNARSGRQSHVDGRLSRVHAHAGMMGLHLRRRVLRSQRLYKLAAH